MKERNGIKKKPPYPNRDDRDKVEKVFVCLLISLNLPNILKSN